MAGAATTYAENMKCQKYAGISQSDMFEPISNETMGVYGHSTSHIINDIGRRLAATTGDSTQLAWFKQWLCLAVQCGNAISILALAQETSSGY